MNPAQEPPQETPPVETPPSEALQGRNSPQPWSVKIATVAGIPIRLHFTFLLFMAWLAFIGQQKGSWGWPLLVLTLFACVVLHELGHALTALHYEVRTKDITLYPIGGIAMLRSKPAPRQEFWIALAGPLVNLVIAALLIAVELVLNRKVDLIQLLSGQSFLSDVIVANITLALFNLIPAFPMDGGRVLRAGLALRMPETKATQIAAFIGQALAIVLMVVGLFTQEIILMVVAVFVYITAGQEAQATVARSFLEGRPVRDAMQTEFTTIEHGANLERAAQMLLAGSQHDFPVTSGEEVIGILTSKDIAGGLASAGSSAYVAEFMNREFKRAQSDLALTTAVEMFGRLDPSPVLVFEDEKLVGMLTSENLSEFITLEAARNQAQKR